MPTKIFVGNITPGTTSAQLSELFRNYGPVTECDVLGMGNYGFVHMVNEVEAETAISCLNGRVFNGSELNVEKSTKSTQGRGLRAGTRGGGVGVVGGRPTTRGGLPRRNTTKLFIGNLKAGVTNEDLRTLFEPFGSVVEADVCGGFGFVHMANEAVALKAMNSLNGHNLRGGCINIELSTKETQGRSSEANRTSGIRATPVSAAVVSTVTPSVRYESFATPAAIQRPSLAVGFNGTTAYSFEIPTVVRSTAVPSVAGVGAIGVGAIGSVAGGTAGGDMFARDLLQLYNKDPEVFDRYAKEQLVRKSLDLSLAAQQPQAVVPAAVTLVSSEAFYRGGLVSMAPAVAVAPAGVVNAPGAAPATVIQQDFYDTRFLTRGLEPNGYETTAALMRPASHLFGGIGYQAYASPAPVATGPIAYTSRLPATAWGSVATGPHVYTMFE